MSQIQNTVNKFLAQNQEDENSQEICDAVTGKCYIKSKDGLIERTIIEKKLVVEDGRELLREETPVSHSRRFLM